MIEREAAVSLLSELVACPSMNPGCCDQAPEPPFGEAALVRLLDELLSDWGAKTEVREVDPGRPNFVATIEGRDPSRTLVLEAHSDTVPTADMATPTPVCRDGRLYGRGACDTKGPMAAMLLGLKSILDADGALPITVHFVSTCNEEAGATGARALVDGGVRADAAITGEPTGLAIVGFHKGVLRLSISTTGTAAHSSTPEQGVNAIYRMTPILKALEQEASRLQTIEAHSLLGHPTLSVGTIHGGSLANVVPDRCTIEIDRRLLSTEDVSDVRASLERIAGPDSEVQTTQYYPALEEDESQIGNVLESACRTVMGRAERSDVPYATNAGIFQAAGIPSVVFGPGDIAQAHTQNESIELDQVMIAADIYAEAIRCFDLEYRAV